MQRIALYSHDAVGLGHLRRNLAIARALADDGRRSILLITGAREAAAFHVPRGVDVLTLPAYAKAGAGQYVPRSLGTSKARLASLRAGTIAAALDAFDPAALIADKHPLGLEGELEPALEHLAAAGARLVLGMRDVLDDARTARREWDAIGGASTVRDVYDDVWVYGDPRVYDPVREARLGPDVAAKARYTGYLGARPGATAQADHRRANGEDELPDGRLAVCLVGGGEDGYPLASAFADAPLPPGMTGVVVAGPFMPTAERRSLHLRVGPRLRVLDFVAEPAPLLERAESVVSMGGYNTVCELLALGKRALIVPRVAPRREQLVRARRLAARGVVDMLHPESADPAALARWLASAPSASPRPRGAVDLGGLRRIPRLLDRSREASKAGALDAA